MEEIRSGQGILRPSKKIIDLVDGIISAELPVDGHEHVIDADLLITITTLLSSSPNGH